MDDFNVIVADKDIENTIKIISSLENVYVFIGGVNPFDEVDININNNIFIAGEKAINIKDITGINIYTSTVANNYGLFDVVVYALNDNLQLAIPYGYKEKLKVLKVKKQVQLLHELCI